MNNRPILMAIKPKYAQRIKSGEKKIELRKVAPRVVSGSLIAFYESTPIKKITMLCEIESIVLEEPRIMWEKYNQFLGIEKKDYEIYFEGVHRAYGLVLRKLQIIEPITIAELGTISHVPQNYCYLRDEDIKRIQQLII